LTLASEKPSVLHGIKEERMNRREFLRLTGAAATACLLPGCARHRTGRHSGPAEAEWSALARSLAGKLIRPGDGAYENARVVYNARFDHVRPQAVVQCANADDVRETLAFVRRFALPVTPRGGGHSYAGYSTGPGVVLDLAPLHSVAVDGDTATIGGGAKLIDVYDRLIANGVCIPAGTCPTVGIAGLTLGGGIGVLDRAHGLTADCLLSAEVVTADGRKLTCDARQNADLFWALRGGGGGNFGVVTSFTFRTHQVRELGGFFVRWKREDGLAVFAGWQKWAQTAGEDIWCALSFWSNPPVFNVLAAGVSVDGIDALKPQIQALIAATGKEPQVHMTKGVGYRDLMLEFAGCGDMNVSQCHVVNQTPDAKLERRAFAGTSDIFDHWLPAPGMEAIVSALDARYTAGQKGAAMFDLMGGAINRVAPDATAFVHRSSVFTAQYFLSLEKDAPAAEVEEAMDWQTGMRARMRPWSTGRAYQNYIDPKLTDWKNAYYGTNYGRLVKVKAAYDPDRVFRFDQGIPPS
jgi:FAD/FMN-containing dehydrogenase